MMEQKECDVTVKDVQSRYAHGTTFREIAEDFQKDYVDDIVLVMAKGRLRELNKVLKADSRLMFVTTKDVIGHKTYKRSVTLLMLKAIHDVDEQSLIENVRVMYSVSHGYYCRLIGEKKLNQEFLEKVEKRMRELVEADLEIAKRNYATDEAIGRFREAGMEDKAQLLAYRRSSRVNVYELDGYEDYYYGYMVPSTGYLKYFALHLYDEGFVLQLPEIKNTKVVPPFEPYEKLFGVLKESSKWGELLNIGTVGALNNAIAEGKARDLILVQEALQEKKIAQIAEQIVEAPDKKFIMIAGPSSSGKTTFSHRLSIQLYAHGKNPYPIGLDNYYLDRDHSPRDENGKFDFECLEALDLEQFNKDMKMLLQGEEVELPVFNFKTGKREYRGNKLRLKDKDVLVIEGIHGLNDLLSYSLPASSKFKIYISALTQLNIDEHNRIPTTDGRLIRRIIRDARTRNTSAQATIEMWHSVRRGEEKHIFPFQEGAEIMFNSALIYELAVLKPYAEPLLFGIKKDAPEYMEAKRLLKFLDYFLPLGSESIAHNSIVREFVGGSCFDV